MNALSFKTLSLTLLLGLSAAPALAKTVEVHMKSGGGKSLFLPATLNITKGTTVKWINDDPSKMPHSVTSGKVEGARGIPDKLFDSKIMMAGKIFEHTFTEAGTFDYYCAPHLAMKMIGQVVVK